MNPQLLRITAQLQLALAVFMAVGCSPAQPFFLNESPDLQYYLNTATKIEYPDVDVASLPDTTESTEPLRIGNHNYQFWDLSMEECVSIALQNAKFFVTTGGNSESRQNVAAQFTSSSADQLGSIYDVAISQTTTQSVGLTVDGAGNRTLPRGVLRANQIGGVEDALAEFDAQASAFISYNTTDRPRNTGLANTVNPPLSEADDVTQQAALSKRSATGGVFTIREQIIYSRNNVDTTGGFARSTPSDYTAILEAQIQHPLMRNRGTMINRIPVVLASLNEDIELTDFEIQIRNLVRDVEVAYWDLHVAYRNVATAVVGRNSAQATQYFARLQFDRGTGTKQEYAQATEQYFNFKGRLSAALAGSNLPGDDRFGVYGRERLLREVLGIAPTDGRLIRPTDEPSLARVEFDWDEINSEMLYLSPELRRGRIIVKQRELETISAKNQILPEVNLSLLYRWVGVGDDLGPSKRSRIPAPLEGSSALAELTGGDFQEAGIRLDYTPSPIGARRERSRIRNSQLREQHSRAYIQEAERLLVSQMSDAIAKVYTHYDQININAQRWQAAETEVTARLAEYELGRSPINTVLQSQQRRADAELAYYRALGEYNKSIGYVDYLKGTSLANSNITLAEGPWNKKAYWDALERARERSAGRHKVYGVTRPGVVRRGPVGNAATAHQMHSGVATDGSLVPPVDEFADPSIMDAMGTGTDIDMQPSHIPSKPLSELGNSTMDVLSPSPEPTTTVPTENFESKLFQEPTTAPVPTPALKGSKVQEIPAPEPEIDTQAKLPPVIRQLDYREPIQSAAEPATRRQIGDVAVGSGADVPSQVPDDDNTFQPVRRKPIPNH
jgi:outer membrane protein TolC